MKAATVERKLSRSAQPKHPHELIRRIEKGLPFRELEDLQKKLDLPLEQLADKLSISRPTLYRRKVAGRLPRDESDRVVRYARLFEQALKYFGSTEKARAWMKFPQWGLGGAIPLDYARTESGAREVEYLLGRMQYGVYS